MVAPEAYLRLGDSRPPRVRLPLDLLMHLAARAVTSARARRVVMLCLTARYKKCGGAHFVSNAVPRRQRQLSLVQQQVLCHLAKTEPVRLVAKLTAQEGEGPTSICHILCEPVAFPDDALVVLQLGLGPARPASSVRMWLVPCTSLPAPARNRDVAQQADWLLLRFR